MGKHQPATPGSNLIGHLQRLGEALGYKSVTEMPVRPDSPQGPAVDVAWLGDGGQRFPLMIFEIESRATNAASNNAVKVFGLQNEAFEKPLFFFHVFLKAGARSSLLDPLRRLFGTHNYRAYNLGDGQQTKLLCDVFTQHRRLYGALPIDLVLEALNPNEWTGIELLAVLSHVEELNFDAPFLATYAHRAELDPTYSSHFYRALCRERKSGGQARQATGYQSYIGQVWAEPVHLGLLALEFSSHGDWLESLTTWQERSSYMTQIGPHFGLSRDYDAFILGMAPALLALVCALMYRVDGAAFYICEQLQKILEKAVGVDPRVSFFAAVWTLHIAAGSNNTSAFEHARKFINERGGIGQRALFDPPSAISIDELSVDWLSSSEACTAVPTLPAFRAALTSRRSKPGDSREAMRSLAFRYLNSDRAAYDSGAQIVDVLTAVARSDDASY
jgi:hypothetical protein